MASKNFLEINQAALNRKASIALLDTAEELVDSLDNLSTCLKQVEEKYLQDAENADKTLENDESLYNQLKENLDAARDLTDSLKREKWRLSRRELSLNLRMGELEDYKKHIKEDMTDMNQTVEALSMRVVQLENALCDQQEVQEALEAEQKELKEHLEESEIKCKNLEDHRNQLQLELRRSKLQRNDSYLKKHADELSSEMEVLQLENRNLKEMIRDKDEILDKQKCVQNEIANGITTKSAQTDALVNEGQYTKANGLLAGIHEGTTIEPETRIEFV